ncbi:MAG TPA: hypothetical protein PLN52_14690 [Opitutaceae bacterium]|nr:hypothetical protein [Opitutaceae bacterium]
MSRTWKVTLVFVGIFVAGAVVGGFVSLRIARSFVQQRGGPDQFALSHKGRLTESLDLTPAQQVRIGAAIDEASEELRKYRKETVRVFQAMDSRIAVELTPAQKEKFEEMQRRWRERRPQRPSNPEERRNGAKRDEGKAPAPGESSPPAEKKGP